MSDLFSGNRYTGYQSSNSHNYGLSGFSSGSSRQGSEINWPAFRSEINNPNHTRTTYIIFIYSPECPHCRNFEPQWKNFIRDNRHTLGSNTVLHKMDATRDRNAQAINHFNVQEFPAVIKMTGSHVKRTMESGYADIDMGYSWLATAAGLQPGEYSGGFPIPIFAKKGQKDLADTVEDGDSLDSDSGEDSDSDRWEDARQGPQLAMTGAPLDIGDNLDDNQESFDTAFERLSAQQAAHPNSEIVYSQEEKTPASMKALAEAQSQAVSQLALEQPLFDGYDNPMNDPQDSFQDDDGEDDDVMSGDDMDAMQYMVRRDQETPGGGLFSEQVRHSATEDTSDNNINQWNEVD